MGVKCLGAVADVCRPHSRASTDRHPKSQSASTALILVTVAPRRVSGDSFYHVQKAVAYCHFGR